MLVAAMLAVGCGEPELPELPDEAYFPDAAGEDVVASAGDSAASGSGAKPSRTAPRLRIGQQLGDDDAPLVIVEFSDPGCVSCSNFSQQTFPDLRTEFIDTGLVQWRTVLIDRGFPNGVPATRAAACAASQGRFWDMRSKLARQQRDWIGRWSPNERFLVYAGELGLDAAAFDDCLESPAPTGMSVEEMVAFNLNVRAVPMFLVGSQRVLGALGADHFRAIILRQLEQTSDT